MLKGINQDDYAYTKWKGFVIEVLNCFDKTNGNWLFLPCSGGYYEQDEMLMTLWNRIRDIYFKVRENLKKGVEDAADST